MAPSLKSFRDHYLETLLRFLWREWTALGVPGQERVPLHHVVDPEALLLFTCSLARYDQRLFDEVVDWLMKNGRYLNVQRMRNILRRESFSGGAVLSAIADWLARRDDPVKWRLLARNGGAGAGPEPLFCLHDGRPLPSSADNDAIFAEHGFLRNQVVPRGYAQPFPPHALPTRVLSLRALFGVNARCDVLVYLALNGIGHPREVARELYYSQKTIHDLMTDMARSGLVQSSRASRERAFRLTADALPFLARQTDTAGWVNWPIFLSAAETIWHKVEELRIAQLDPLVESSEISLTMKLLLERLTRARWMPAMPASEARPGNARLHAFAAVFDTLSM